MMTALVHRDLYDYVMVPIYEPADIVPVRGQGSKLWDQDGKEYIDFSGGVAVNALGHCHPVLIDALERQSRHLWHTSNHFANEPAIRMASALTKSSFAERVFFANSGAEANEAAFKLARRYGLEKGGPEKHEIVAAQNSFHGRSLFTVSVGGQSKYSSRFGPAIQGIRHVPFNDLDALDEAISAKTCAVVLEPIQGQSGVLPASRAYLKRARELCDRHGALLIFDEVQTGMGRLGTLYGYQYFGVTPDVMTLAKAVGCGIPLAAMLTTAPIAQSLPPGSHGSTFGGNPLACAVGAAAFQVIAQPELLAGVTYRHARLSEGLRLIGERYEMFSEVRGIGLLLGCVLTPQWRGRADELVHEALSHGVVILQAGDDVVRLAPSLIIEAVDIDEGLTRLERTAAALSSRF